MNKQKFLNIIQSQIFNENDDVISFQKIAKQHPYSQVAHTLLAKHHSTTKSTEAKSYIQKAALYATDRVVLKKIIESTPTPTIVESNRTSESAAVSIQDKPHNFKSSSSELSNIGQLREDIFKHLDQLQESKRPYTELNATKIDKVKKAPKIKSGEKTKIKAKSTVKKKDKSEKKIASTPSKGLKKEKDPLSQKEQVDLIEKFIHSPPKIAKSSIKSTAEENQKDLSKINAKIEEDFASENLAQILIKQGNKDKAIEIYKKLIWKFPQKKAYFATQIEGLKK